MGEHAPGLTMFVLTAGLLVVVVLLRARIDPGTRERRALRSVGTEIWEWFARFERGGGRVQDLEGLSWGPALRARKVVWLAAAQLIGLLMLTAAIYLAGWPWWIPLIAALLLIVAGGYFGEVRVFLADDTAATWRYEGSRGLLLLGLVVKGVVLCAGLGLVWLAADLLISAPALLALAVAIVAAFVFDRCHIPARAIEGVIRSRQSIGFAENATGETILYLRSFDDEPGRCHNRPATESTVLRGRCGADLTSTEEFVAAHSETREAQRVILRVVATGIGEFGIYEDGRPSTIQVLSDMLLLSRAGRQALVDGERFEWMPTGQADASPITSHRRTGKVDLRPSTAREVALGNTIAFEALQAGERITDLLRGRVSIHTALDHYSPPLRDHVSRALGRTRRPTATLQAVKVWGTDPEVRAAKLPAVLWPEWTARLAPRRLDAEIAGGALAAAVVFVGTRLTHGSAIKLLDQKAKGRQVSHVMRSLGRNAPEADTILAIARLAAFLDETPTPIDFARRRTIDYSGILPRDEWREICRTANVLPGGVRRWQVARAHLYVLLSGNRLARAPFADEPGFPPLAAVRELRAGMPSVVAAALAAAGADFLRLQGVDEPVSWVPELEVVGVSDEVASPNEGRWPQARPARAAVNSARAVAAYSAGRSVGEIAFDHGVARQTVGRVLAAEGVETRRGRRSTAIDPEWLRERYIVDRHTIPELAAEVGVTMTTINRHLEAAGIPRRARGSASRATAIRVDPRAGDSRLLRRILVGQDAPQRAERFLIVARHDTMTAAAHEIGVTLSILANQMKRIGSDSGGALITRAQRGQPLTLTELGVEVRRELAAAFGVSGAEGPAHPAEGSQ